jgi:hypothetical protein
MLSILVGGVLAYRSLGQRAANIEAAIRQGFADGSAASVKSIGEVKAEIHDQLTPVTRAAAGTLNAATGAVREASGAIADARRKLDPVDLNGQLLSITKPAADSAENLSALLKGAQPVLASAASVTHQVDEALPLWLDCEFNPDCAFNRYQGTMKAIEKTAIAVGVEAPKMAQHADSVARSFADMAASIDGWIDRLTAPKTLKERMKAWLQFGVLASARFL